MFSLHFAALAALVNLTTPLPGVLPGFFIGLSASLGWTLFGWVLGRRCWKPDRDYGHLLWYLGVYLALWQFFLDYIVFGEYSWSRHWLPLATAGLTMSSGLLVGLWAAATAARPSGGRLARWFGAGYLVSGVVTLAFVEAAPWWCDLVAFSYLAIGLLKSCWAAWGGRRWRRGGILLLLLTALLGIAPLLFSSFQQGGRWRLQRNLLPELRLNAYCNWRQLGLEEAVPPTEVVTGSALPALLLPEETVSDVLFIGSQHNNWPLIYGRLPAVKRLDWMLNPAEWLLNQFDALTLQSGTRLHYWPRQPVRPPRWPAGPYQLIVWLEHPAGLTASLDLLARLARSYPEAVLVLPEAWFELEAWQPALLETYFYTMPLPGPDALRAFSKRPLETELATLGARLKERAPEADEYLLGCFDILYAISPPRPVELLPRFTFPAYPVLKPLPEISWWVVQLALLWAGYLALRVVAGRHGMWHGRFNEFECGLSLSLLALAVLVRLTAAELLPVSALPAALFGLGALALPRRRTRSWVDLGLLLLALWLLFQPGYLVLAIIPGALAVDGIRQRLSVANVPLLLSGAWLGILLTMALLVAGGSWYWLPVGYLLMQLPTALRA